MPSEHASPGQNLETLATWGTDSFAYLGLAAFYADSWMLWAVLAALVGGLMVSYTRARAEGLGVACLVGLLQRPERYVILGLGSIFGSLVQHMTGWTLWGQSYALVVLTVLVLAVLSNVTALQRVSYVMRELRRRPRE